MSEKLTWLSYSPVIFPGFNQTLISPEVYIDHWEIYDYGESYGVYASPDFWYSYMTYVGEQAAEIIGAAVKKFQKGVVLDVKFKQIWSPRSYESATDRLFLTLDVRKDKLDDWIFKHSGSFCDYLEGHWTSREGFASLVPNTLSGILKSPFYEKITLEYFIREACLRLGVDEFRDVEGRLYSYIVDLPPDEVEDRISGGDIKMPFREKMGATA